VHASLARGVTRIPQAPITTSLMWSRRPGLKGTDCLIRSIRHRDECLRRGPKPWGVRSQGALPTLYPSIKNNPGFPRRRLKIT
jgi:hypothetical protein